MENHLCPINIDITWSKQIGWKIGKVGHTSEERVNILRKRRLCCWVMGTIGECLDTVMKVLILANYYWNSFIFFSIGLEYTNSWTIKSHYDGVRSVFAGFRYLDSCPPEQWNKSSTVWSQPVHVILECSLIEIASFGSFLPPNGQVISMTWVTHQQVMDKSCANLVKVLQNSYGQALWKSWESFLKVIGKSSVRYEY